jgi:uncharacterized membrane protein YkoI
MRTTIVALLICLLPACNGAPAPRADCPPCPTAAKAPKPTAATATAAAKKAPEAAVVHPRVVKAAATFKEVSRAKLRTDAKGAVTKLSLYHNDAAKVPDNIKKMAEKKFEGATVRFYELERYADIGWVQEVEVKTADGKNCELSVREDGTENYVECEIPVAELAKPIADAVAKKLPDGKIVEVETKKGPKIDQVHVEVEVGKMVHKLHFSPDGKLLLHLLKIPAELEVPAP